MINPKIFTFWGWNPTGDFGPWTCYTAKNKKPVMFIKAPPTEPPTDRQTYQRESWRTFARMWKLLPKHNRDLWELATKRAHLFITGYNLYIWWKTTRDLPTLNSIIRQSKVPIPY